MNNCRVKEIKKVGFAYFATKRFFDIFLSFLGIVLLSWLLILIALLVLILTGWPIIYRDQRVGRKGKMFYCLKFRSMRKDANKRIEEYLSKEDLEKWQKERKVDKDPRITCIGKILRKTSLDELPQFFNIFIGQMSIIGPRPITSKELNEHFTPQERELLTSVRPGLFSNWSVNGRSTINFDSGLRQKYELEYFEKRSIWFEIKLFFKVIGVVITMKGAK